MSSVLPPVVPQVIAGGVSLGGMWIVVKLALRFQSDFTDRYIERNRSLEERICVLEAQEEKLREAMRLCEQREVQMMRVLASHGISISGWVDPAG
jgi:hypothetical protein